MFHAALILQLQVICDALHKLAFSLPFLASRLLATSSSLVTDAAASKHHLSFDSCHSWKAFSLTHQIKIGWKKVPKDFGQDGTCFVQMVVCEYCQRSIWEKHNTAGDGGILRWATTHSHSPRRKAGTVFWQRWERFCCGQCEQLVSSLYCPVEEKALWLVSTVTLNLWPDVD